MKKISCCKGSKPTGLPYHRGTAESSFTAKKWFGHAFYRQILSLLYRFFSSETSAPGSPGNHNHQDHPISEKVPGAIPRGSPLAVRCLLLLAVWFLLLLAVAVVAVVPAVAVVALVVPVAALVAFGGASGAAAII